MTASQSVYRDMAISEWTKVVSNPLGLAGFALFLVFAYLAKVKSADERRWLSPAAVLVALAALLGGLLIAYAQIPKPALPAQTNGASPSQQMPRRVEQISTGEGSPNIQGVQGNITLTIDQSKAKTAPEPASARQPDQK
jgi:hypothetical protein